MFRYALTIFVSAFLLFQVQPLIGRFILPWFGGGPSIWTACMLFFQVLLLSGYLYAHLISVWLSVRGQVLVHLSLLMTSVLLLPIAPGDAWKPTGEQSPLLQILLLLTAATGGPYFLLSSTGPLMQRWFSRSSPDRSPWRLYALSNVGSLLALLSYPIVVEPWLPLHQQVTIWTALYLVYVISAAWCGVQLLWSERRATSGATLTPVAKAAEQSRDALSDEDFAHRSSRQVAPRLGGELRSNLPTEIHTLPADAARQDAQSALPSVAVPSASIAPSWGRMVLWLALAACGSLMLLATTNQMCIDVATVPFLWVLPLSLYLLTFIICFDNPQWYDRRVFGLLLLVCGPAACWVLSQDVNVAISDQVVTYSTVLFACCMTCHGELVRSRPNPQYLTLFFVLVSAGGALGGLLVAIVAPRVFPGYWEYHVGLAGCCLMTLVAWCADRAWRNPLTTPFWIWTLATAVQVTCVARFLYNPTARILEAIDHTVLTGGYALLLTAGLAVTASLEKKTKTLYVVWPILAIVQVGWLIGYSAWRFPDLVSLSDYAALACSGLLPALLAIGMQIVFNRFSELTRETCIRVFLLLSITAGLAVLWYADRLDAWQVFAIAASIPGALLLEWVALLLRGPQAASPGVWFWIPAATLLVLLGTRLTRIVQEDSDDIVHVSRNFYGVLRVQEDDAEAGEEYSLPPRYSLTHGQIQHGFQFIDDDYWSRQPTTYYGHDSGIGLAIRLSRQLAESTDQHPFRVGVVGLGTGTLAVYGETGDYFRFYEINPDVRSLSDTFFTYLRDSAAQTEVAIGDARIVMERDITAGHGQQFDVLAIDAFSSDAIPVHLLTTQCGDIYRQNLRPGGVLAIHVSNRFLDLDPVVRGLAGHLGWQAFRIDNDDDDSIGVFTSSWILLTSSTEFAGLSELQDAHTPWEDTDPILQWTDDYSGLWRVLTF